MADVTQKNYYQKELVAFNKGFQAYNKRMMYGADVISVVNKAIDNNRKYGNAYYDGSNSQKDYFVNIRFKYEGIEYSLSNETSYKSMYNKWIQHIGIKEGDPNNNDDEKKYRELMGKRFECQDVIYNKKEEGCAEGAIGRIREMIFNQVT